MMNRFLRQTMIAFIGWVLLTGIVSGKTVKTGQVDGCLQKDESKQVQFSNFERINFDFDRLPLKKVKKIALHQNKIFILDSKRSELYVIDKKGNYLNTIGRPGEGPGDLEYCYDFFISNDEKIFVLNSLPKRVEIFDINGKPLKSIKLKTPTAWEFPDALLVDSQEHFIIASPLNHLVAVNSSSGNYERTILEREKKVEESAPILGIPPQLEFLSNRRDILHFDRFKGIFTKMDNTGAISAVFSGHVDKLDETIKKIEEELPMRARKKTGSLSSFVFWTDFCIDEKDNIYTMPLSREEGKKKMMFVFSSEGQFLYRKALDYFEDTLILSISCDKDSFIFMTYNFDLVIAHRR
jgi:hypothetical protein